VSRCADRSLRGTGGALLAALALAVLLVLLAGPAVAQVDGAPQSVAPELPAAPVPGQPAEPGAQPIEVPAVPGVQAVPDVVLQVDGGTSALSQTVTVILLLTVGSVAPGLLLLMTTFTRFIIVLGLAKNALALQTVPPAQVLVGLSLFLSWFVMAPVFSEINSEAVQPLLAGEIAQEEAFGLAFAPLQTFMLAQTRDADLALFHDLAGGEELARPSDVPASTLIPAFVISELRTAFIIGFIVFVPFLVIDLVVAAVLMAMGMVMLPPVFISLPIKLLLFIMVDGWVLLVSSLVRSVNGFAI
jgi:flagellar biosynthesis protein FliP